MSAITFSYRSAKDKSFLEVRLSFRVDGIKNPYSFYSRSNIEVEKEYWNELHTKTDFPNYKDVDKQNWVKELKQKQYQVNTEIDKLRTHILTAFNSVPNTKVLNVINKIWLKNQIELYYNPPQPEEKTQFPDELLKCFDAYIENKSDLKANTIKKINVIKNLLTRYEKSKRKAIKVIDVNPDFQKDFEKYLIKNDYAKNTFVVALKFIKTICNYSRKRGVKTHDLISEISAKWEKITPIYLTFAELEQIEKTNDLPEYLENAKDFLIISCYTSQRVSDFLRFNSDMIRYEKGKPLLEFTQQKTNKIMTIPVHKKVIEILEKRNGQFPRQISDVNYNLYIKEVCKRANLTQMVKGSKKVETEPESKQYRKETGMYPKYELVTSHIGRRSFCSNFYGLIPTTFLIYMSGHSTEQMLLTYIGKSNKDLAKEMFKYFEL